jgi:hypothetical protein
MQGKAGEIHYFGYEILPIAGRNGERLSAGRRMDLIVSNASPGIPL